MRVCLVTLAGLSAAGRALDAASGGALARAMAVAAFKGEAKRHIEVFPQSGPAERVLLVGLGDAAKFGGGWLNLGGRLRARLAAMKVTEAELLLEAEGLAPTAADAGQLALGAALRGYSFRRYKRRKAEGDADEDAAGEAIALRILTADPEAARTHHERDAALGAGVLLARDLVNEPPNLLGPMDFAERIRALAHDGLTVEVLEKPELETRGFGALLAVGQGSERPSAVVIMRWDGGEAGAAPVALIGKGVTFDTGGISIKPALGMEEMKGDMGGAAAVVGCMLALARRKARVNVVGAVGLTENMPSGTAMRPGDIITSLSGQTIEVLNTDAEGRLVLADVMWHVGEAYSPRAMVTLATLTGAIIVALGREHAGLFANNDALAAALTEAGLATDEKVWRLPLHAKYDKLIDSRIADMKNIGGRDAGSITAAQFLQRFVKDGIAWAHLDVAGTAMASPPSDVNASWGSGYGVRLLNAYIEKLAG